MLKMVLSDYIHNWKSAWKELAYEEWGMYVYFLAFPWITRMSAIEIIVYLCTMLPLVGGVLLARMFPNRMNKTLFLCPMSKEDRIAYFKTAFKFRVSVPVFLFFLIEMVLFFIGYISLDGVIFMFLVFFLYIVSVNIYWCYWSEGKQRNIYTEKNPLSGTFFIWDMLSRLGIINVIIVSGVSVSGYEWSDYVLVGCLITWQFLVFLKLVTCYYKKVMELSVNYEMGYVQIEKQKA